MDKVIVIVGPTASGKTASSIALAQRLNGEIINGDSLQVYRRLNIGTAKIQPDEMQGVPHHLFDILSPEETFSVKDYQTLVREKIREIQSREKVPILVGGTGLYIRAVLYQFQFTEEVGDEATRKKWEDYAEKYGNEQLHEQLAQVDPKSAASIHPNNIRRVVRALEIYEKTGQTKVEQEANTGDEIVIPHLIFGMDRPREELYERINERVIQMIEEGLEEEVRQLIADGFRNTQAMTGIGYKEWYPFLDGHLSKQAVIEAIQQNSRRYAKRQLTYFRHQLPVHWIDARRSIVEQVKEMEEIWTEKGKNDE